MKTGEEPNVTAITLGVRDVGRSANFYVDGLGFTEVSRMGDEICFVQAGPGLLLALWNIASMPSEYGDVAHGSAAPPMSLGHNVATADDVTRWYRRACDAGAESITEPTTRDWGGTSACVADPDGFRWDFVHNPAFGVNAEGKVSV